MKIGGGGYVVGMDISPTKKDLMFIRADVSGAYRWNPATSSMKQLVAPPERVGYGKYAEVDKPRGSTEGTGERLSGLLRDVVWMGRRTDFPHTNRGDEKNRLGLRPGGILGQMTRVVIGPYACPSSPPTVDVRAGDVLVCSGQSENGV